MHLAAGLKLAMQPRMTPKLPISTFECWESRCISPHHCTCLHGTGDRGTPGVLPPPHTHTSSHGAGDPGTLGVLSPHTHLLTWCRRSWDSRCAPLYLLTRCRRSWDSRCALPPPHISAHMVQEIMGLEACPTPVPAEDQPGACSPSPAQSPRVSDGDPHGWVRAPCG